MYGKIFVGLNNHYFNHTVESIIVIVSVVELCGHNAWYSTENMAAALLYLHISSKLIKPGARKIALFVVESVLLTRWLMLQAPADERVEVNNAFTAFPLSTIPGKKYKRLLR